MRILVLSDSHQYSSRVKKAVEVIDGVSVIVHLGDGERDMACVENLSENVQTVQVRGNCDFGSDLPAEQLFEVRGKRIFCTHGHLYHVKYGVEMLADAAQRYGADITLYGHTHVPVTKCENGRYFFNPGSLLDGNFGYIDIVSNGINCVHLNLRDLK